MSSEPLTSARPTEVVSSAPTGNIFVALITSLIGKSDPYAVFTLNGDKVFKTEVIKKTLAPVWNQNFNALVVRC